MRIEFKSSAARPRRWILDLAAGLEARGHRVAFEIVRPSRPKPGEAGLDLLVALESLLYGLPQPRASGTADWPRRTADFALPGDLVIDFSGDALAGPVETATLVPLQDGAVGEAGTVDALLDGRSPSLSAALREPGEGHARVVATVLPALEEPLVFARSFDRVLARTGTMILQAVERWGRGELGSIVPGITPNTFSPSPNVIRASAFFAANLARKIARRLQKLSSIENHWRIGWRWTSSDEVASRLAWSTAPYAFIPDDAKRFYADPFIFWLDGVAHVFCEEYPYATRKGVISVFTIGRDGLMAPPRVVLERPYHLSYPMVFERDGAILMIPETSANRTIELYRAKRFPDEWTLDAVLVKDVSAADATLVERDGLLWLFAAIVEGGSSSWDALGLYFAPSLKGPWSAHPANPVLIDASSARPGGLTILRGKELLRPAQDCMGGYGSALTLCRIDRLDPEYYAQTRVARLAPQPVWRAHGTHTLNFADGLEVIDCVGRRARRA